MKASVERRWWLLLLMPILMQNVCGKHDDTLLEPDQYIAWQVSGTRGILIMPKDSFGFFQVNNSTSLSAISKPVSNTSIDLSFDSPQQSGNYSSSNFAARMNGRYYTQSSPLSVSVLNYGSVGQYIVGSYNGNVKDTLTSLLTTISGEFRVRVK